jgi:hypothetical protein
VRYGKVFQAALCNGDTNRAQSIKTPAGAFKHEFHRFIFYDHMAEKAMKLIAEVSPESVRQLARSAAEI